MTDTEIKTKGIQILTQHLGNIDAERFVTLIKQDSLDDTALHLSNINTPSIDELSYKVMALRTQDLN